MSELRKWMKKSDCFDKDLFSELQKLGVVDTDYDFSLVTLAQLNKIRDAIKQERVVGGGASFVESRFVKKVNVIRSAIKKQNKPKKKKAFELVDSKQPNNTEQKQQQLEKDDLKCEKPKTKKKRAMKDIYNDKDIQKINTKFDKIKTLSLHHLHLIVNYTFRKSKLSKKKFHLSNNSELKKELFFTICKFFELFSSGSMGNLVVQTGKLLELRSAVNHHFENVTVKPAGSLTVEEFVTQMSRQNADNLAGKGGVLYLNIAGSLILHEKAKLTVRGKGYKGGNGKGLIGDKGQGLGGGDPGWGDSAFGGHHGGVYGDDTWQKLELGSGGGAYHGAGTVIQPGGSGGGVLRVQCTRLIMKNGSLITASGQSSVNGGGGSGGTIDIRCAELIMGEDAKISNVGGKGEGDPYSKGKENGGHGRTRIHTMASLPESVKENIKCDFVTYTNDE